MFSSNEINGTGWRAGSWTIQATWRTANDFWGPVSKAPARLMKSYSKKQEGKREERKRERERGEKRPSSSVVFLIVTLLLLLLGVLLLFCFTLRWLAQFPLRFYNWETSETGATVFKQLERVRNVTLNSPSLPSPPTPPTRWLCIV